MGPLRAFVLEYGFQCLDPLLSLLGVCLINLFDGTIRTPFILFSLIPVIALLTSSVPGREIVSKYPVKHKRIFDLVETTGTVLSFQSRNVLRGDRA